jgi:hypothetical protein
MTRDDLTPDERRHTVRNATQFGPDPDSSPRQGVWARQNLGLVGLLASSDRKWQATKSSYIAVPLPVPVSHQI